eukprot:TRINITY_DN3600_c0_g1_i3.p1 TRINITY_DN3600_c0_g1~~TRINITY_DN3600_c0_g1_i3.p1  ORF type:complete len:591 (-),score=56.65 TRINITY_DN3600_c0_g1_i3:881-2653(-)
MVQREQCFYFLALLQVLNLVVGQNIAGILKANPHNASESFFRPYIQGFLLQTSDALSTEEKATDTSYDIANSYKAYLSDEQYQSQQQNQTQQAYSDYSEQSDHYSEDENQSAYEYPVPNEELQMYENVNNSGDNYSSNQYVSINYNADDHDNSTQNDAYNYVQYVDSYDQEDTLYAQHEYDNQSNQSAYSQDTYIYANYDDDDDGEFGSEEVARTNVYYNNYADMSYDSYQDKYEGSSQQDSYEDTQYAQIDQNDNDNDVQNVTQLSNSISVPVQSRSQVYDTQISYDYDQFTQDMQDVPSSPSPPPPPPLPPCQGKIPFPNTDTLKISTQFDSDYDQKDFIECTTKVDPSETKYSPKFSSDKLDSQASGQLNPYYTSSVYSQQDVQQSQQPTPTSPPPSEPMSYSPKLPQYAPFQFIPNVTLQSSLDASIVQQVYLELHNKYRNKHCIQELQWDEGLVESARQYSYGCTWGHDPPLLQGLQQGENLYAYGPITSYTMSPEEVMSGWYNEIDLYDYSNPVFEVATGHFTQIVWSDTTQVGCYIHTCPEYVLSERKSPLQVPGDWEYVVCRYNPPGNFKNLMAEKVTPQCS